MPLRLSLITVISALFFLAGSSQADIISPIGFNPGDPYRIVFVTEGTRDATSSDIAVYDTFVTSEANMPGSLTASLATNWRVIGSTPTVDAKIHTATDDSPAGINSVPIFLVDGTTKIADDYDDLWDSSIDSPLNLDQFGSTAGTQLVWAGTRGGGLRSTNQALGNRNEFFGFTSLVGTTESSATAWIISEEQSDNLSYPYYSISDELTAVPEPSSLLCLGLFGLGVAGRRRRRNLCTQ